MTVQVDLISMMDEMKKRKIRIAPVHSNRASELGHPCLRYLVYLRTRWQERIPHDISLQYIFDDGSAGEKSLISELEESGIRVIHQQKDPYWPKYNISGHIDGKIEDNGRWIPLEIKTINQFDFQKINSIEDCMQSKKTWLKKIPAQINLYMLMENEEDGVILLKSRGRPKQINVHLDYDYAESLIKKAEEIEKHVREGTVPDPIEDHGVCEGCTFYHICLPTQIHTNLIEDDPETEAMLERWYELKNKIKPLEKEFEEIQGILKTKFKEKSEVMIGNFIITGKWVEKKGFEVKPSRYWDMKIKPLKVNLIQEE